MFSAKDNDDSFVRQHTHHTTGGAGGERSELHDSHGRKQTHQTTREEEDLPDLSNVQVLLPQSDVTYQNASNCGTLYQHHAVGWGGGGGGGLASTAPYMGIM